MHICRDVASNVSCHEADPNLHEPALPVYTFQPCL